MQLHQVQRTNPNKKSTQVGRGGKRGKTSGRGTKGQNARSGNSKRPEMRDIIKKLPKLRGYAFNSIKDVNQVINVAALEERHEAGEVTPVTLKAARMIRSIRKPIKILGNGELTKKFVVSGCVVSKTAKTKIEAAGGSLV